MWPILKRLEFRGLRHRFISELQEAGASTAHTPDRDGHSSISTANRHSHDANNGHAYADTATRLFPVRVHHLLSE
jgi:hypothetical protein